MLSQQLFDDSDVRWSYRSAKTWRENLVAVVPGGGLDDRQWLHRILHGNDLDACSPTTKINSICSSLCHCYAKEPITIHLKL